MLDKSILDMNLKISSLRLQQHPIGANEFTTLPHLPMIDIADTNPLVLCLIK